MHPPRLVAKKPHGRRKDHLHAERERPETRDVTSNARHSMPRRLNDLLVARPLDRSLRNLASLLDRALETSARLRIFAAEAAHDGLDECAQVYDRLERSEREQILELEVQLRRQLDAALEDARARGDQELERVR
jgi:hypothetical protein